MHPGVLQSSQRRRVFLLNSSVQSSHHCDHPEPSRADFDCAWLMAKRHDIRADGIGWTVFDVFTGQAVVIHEIPQTGLRVEDAQALARLMNDPNVPTRRIWQ